MKNILQFKITFVLLLIGSYTLHGQWIQTNGPYGGCINDLISINSILVSGNAEGMFISADNGSNWNKITPDNIPRFDSFRRFGRIGSNLFVATYGKGVFLSTNNGSRWMAVNTGLTDQYVFSLLVSDTILFAGTEKKGIFISSDLGGSWTIADNNLIGRQVITLEKFGPNLFAGTNNGIYRSSDGGHNWSPSDSGLPVTPNGVFSFCSLDSVLFCVIDGIGIFRSSDSGISWIQSNSGLQTLWCLHKIFTIDTRIFVNTCSGIYCSTDYGNSWNSVEFPRGEILCCFYNESYIFIGTSIGIYRSIDKGTTWVECNQGMTVPVRCIARTETNLFAGTRSGGIFRTSDNGSTWSHLTDCTGYVDAIAATDTTIFASNQGSSGHGPDGNIFRSTDSGKTWWTMNSGLTTTNVPSLVITAEFIFAGTLGAGVFRSSNNGTIWLHASSGLTNDTVWSLAESAPNLYAGTNDGVFLSTDNGISWNQIGLKGNIINSLAVSESLIIAQAWPGGLCISTDNGASWSFTEQLPNNNFNSAIGPINLFSSQTIPKLSDISALAVSNDLLFAGTSRSVWKIPTFQITDVYIPDRNVPTVFLLFQNYPNPFNPSTTIRYCLPLSSRVSLKIYNVLGQQIADLVNTEQSAGWYETVWNANVSSGLYFYRIDAVSTADPQKRFTQLKKMLLLK